MIHIHRSSFLNPAVIIIIIITHLSESGWSTESHCGQTLFICVQVEQSKVLVKEGGVQLLLTIVDTPGFGDAVDNSNWYATKRETSHAN